MLGHVIFRRWGYSTIEGEIGKERGMQSAGGGVGSDWCANPSFTLRVGKAENVGKARSCWQRKGLLPDWLYCLRNVWGKLVFSERRMRRGQKKESKKSSL